jgi:GTP cyclohydrolase I
MTPTTPNPTVFSPQADPQSENDPRGIHLDTVGIDRVQHPVRIAGWEEDASVEQSTQATFALSVSLAAEKRGIHMSRLMEALHAWDQTLAPSTLEAFLTHLRQQQGAASAEMTCAFVWFTRQTTPQSQRPTLQGIETTWHASQTDHAGTTIGYTLRIPVTTLCPCSREISDYGAHSQRSWITLRTEWQSQATSVPPGLLYARLSQCGSAPIYSLLKRPDERHVTMQAYENPAFVEDVARRAALALRAEPRIRCFRIDVRNEESIHTHDAIATVTSYRAG